MCAPDEKWEERHNVEDGPEVPLFRMLVSSRYWFPIRWPDGEVWQHGVLIRTGK